VAVLRQSQRLSLMQADFVANVSHQLKTPLSLLSTAIETLRLGRVPADRFQQYLEILSSQTMRMTALIERILHFSRLDSDPEAYRMEPVNLVPLVGAVVDRFKTGDRQQIPVAFAPASAAVVVRADAHAIEQVVANLLENAVKYGDERNSVEVSVARSNGSAAISVRDHGIGIHHDDLPYIFDKFYRGRTGDQGRPGFGLGLALVQSIARAHGGRATVRTEYNAGSEFTLIIPAIAEDAADAVSDTRH